MKRDRSIPEGWIDCTPCKSGGVLFYPSPLCCEKSGSTRGRVSEKGYEKERQGKEAQALCDLPSTKTPLYSAVNVTDIPEYCYTGSTPVQITSRQQPHKGRWLLSPVVSFFHLFFFLPNLQAENTCHEVVKIFKKKLTIYHVLSI